MKFKKLCTLQVLKSDFLIARNLPKNCPWPILAKFYKNVYGS